MTRAAALFVLFAALQAHAAPPAIPPTPAGQFMKAFLTRFDDGSLTHDPVWGSWYALYGPLRFQFVATASPYDLRVWTRSDVTETWVTVRVILDSRPPHEMRDVRIGTGLVPHNAPPEAPLSIENALDGIDRYLSRLAEADAFSGAVLIARNGAPIYRRAIGMASKRYGVPNTLDTRFNLGSLTKLITAVAVAQLADAGKLSFQDPIRKFLPAYPSSATIHQLLTHSAGLPKSRFQREEFIDRFARSVSEQLAMTLERVEPPPGESVRYSNEGYVVLGAIVEIASGENYYDYVARHIDQPAGMTDSGAFEGDREVPNLATGYTRWRLKPDGSAEFEAGERRNTSFMSALRGNPAGGTYSTVGDLNRLVQAIESCTLVRCATRDAMMQRQVSRPALPWAGAVEGYGYGVETKTLDGVELVGKSGELAGASAQLLLDRRHGITLIVLSNYDSIAQPVAEAVEGRLMRVVK